MQSPPDFEALARRFWLPELDAIVLMGSHARGDAGAYSDIDLVRFWKSGKTQPPPKISETESLYIDGQLVVVSNLDDQGVEKIFTDPDAASQSIKGLRAAKSLIDPAARFAAIQSRAHAFSWDSAMQKKANAWASRQMVGWIEETHKAMEGLRRKDTGRLLNARFGLSWGMLGVMRVAGGILLTGDNSAWDEVMGALGPESEWSRLCRRAFGIDGNALDDQVLAGLHLFVLSVHIKQYHWTADCLPKIHKAAEYISAFLQDWSA